MSVNEKMTAIADSIRARTGGAELMTLDDIAEGIAQVFEAGKQAERDRFWEGYMAPNTIWRSELIFRGNGWNTHTFYPTRDIKISANCGAYCFSFFNYGFSEFDLRQRLIDCGVTLDTSSITSANGLFNACKVTVLPVIDISNATSADYIFSECNAVTIEKLILGDSGNVSFTKSCFWDRLQNIVIEGIIGQNISFSVSPLTYESAMSVINALKDYSDTGTTRILTLSAATKAYLSDSDIAIATQKGWTVA